jgi:hypothetical protein
MRKAPNILRGLTILGLVVLVLGIAAQVAIGIATGELEAALGTVLSFGLWAALSTAVFIAAIGFLPATVAFLVVASRRKPEPNNLAAVDASPKPGKQLGE